ncbi:MAG: cation-translocating P-type ATPase [Ruminococcus sp.]|nr:cation-translocating P-type ATPase [Ruminococcus sp.]
MTETPVKPQEKLFSEPSGLTEARARRLLNLNGPNRLAAKKRRSAASIFAGQFRDLMVMILLVAAGVSVLIGEIADAVPIMLILVTNAVLGFFQEYRAEKTLEKLTELTAPTAKVRRDGRLVTIPAESIVVGDVIELEAGDRVPADCVILSSRGLCCDESLLTGESAACDKSPRLDRPDITSPSLEYMVYMGTVVLKGSACCEVTATGMHTQMGKVSDLLQSTGEELTPLQQKLGELGRVLAVLCLGVCVIVFAAGVLRGENILEMLMTSISIAVAAIPEGLPAAVTIALALAVRRMLAQKALINRLHSVETLGCASVICTDKTGTLTQNRMTVTGITVCSEKDEALTLSNGRLMDKSGGELKPWDNSALRELLCCAAVCNNARLETVDLTRSRDRGGEISGLKAFGDPTEAALLTAAVSAGIDAESFRRLRTDELPFDSERRYMTVTVTDGGESRIYKKGAPDAVLSSCGYVISGEGEALPLGDARRRAINNAVESYAADGGRVLGFSLIAEGREVFLGVMSLSDPLRPEAERAVRECSKAGIRTVMITGDHKLTACAIAREAGILTKGMTAVTGAELDKLSDQQLDDILDETAVFARVSPEHKLRIVRAFKRRGKVCAMTGDGVNDAPAVREASIGVAMGQSGTDVTKQAADCILLDDNFATLVTAVREGRTIYQSIRKFVRYLISCNIGEVLTMLGGIIMGLPIVLLPAQILLVNLVTDGLPAIALGAEPSDPDIMEHPPRSENESFFSGGLLYRMIVRGALIGIVTLAAFTVVLKLGGGLAAARSAALVTLVLTQLVHVYECRSEERSLFRHRTRAGAFIHISVGISLACMLAAMYVPFLAGVFALIPLTAVQWLVCIALTAAIPLLASLIGK